MPWTRYVPVERPCVMVLNPEQKCIKNVDYMLSAMQLDRLLSYF
jgi:hypothetical protein